MKIQDLPISASNWEVSMMNTALFEDCLNIEETCSTSKQNNDNVSYWHHFVTQYFIFGLKYSGSWVPAEYTTVHHASYLVTCYVTRMESKTENF